RWRGNRPRRSRGESPRTAPKNDPPDRRRPRRGSRDRPTLSGHRYRAVCCRRRGGTRPSFTGAAVAVTPRERELIQQRGEPPGARVSRRLGRGHIDGSGEVDVDLRPMPSRRLTAHRGEQLAERAAASSDGDDGKLPGVRGTADERTGGHAGATS